LGATKARSRVHLLWAAAPAEDAADRDRNSRLPSICSKRLTCLAMVERRKGRSQPSGITQEVADPGDHFNKCSIASHGRSNKRYVHFARESAGSKATPLNPSTHTGLWLAFVAIILIIGFAPPIMFLPQLALAVYGAATHRPRVAEFPMKWERLPTEESSTPREKVRILLRFEHDPLKWIVIDGDGIKAFEYGNSGRVDVLIWWARQPRRISGASVQQIGGQDYYGPERWGPDPGLPEESCANRPPAAGPQRWLRHMPDRQAWQRGESL
jgi:hypothetical protein